MTLADSILSRGRRIRSFKLRPTRGDNRPGFVYPLIFGNSISASLRDTLHFGLHLIVPERSPDYSHPVKTKTHFSGITRVGFALGAALLVALTNGAGSADGHGIGLTATPPGMAVQDNYIDSTIHLFFLAAGICLLISGGVMLKHLSEFQRRTGSGGVQRTKSEFSFKTRRRAAIGFLVGGVLFVIGWSFHVI